MRWRAWLVLLLCAAVAVAAPPADPEAPLREAVWNAHWLEGVRRYAELESTGKRVTPQASYLAGLSQWKLRHPEDARPLLKRAADAGFHSSGGRPQPQALLTAIDTYLELRPERMDVKDLDPALLEPYVEARTKLTAPILDALPRIAKIGAKIFDSPPPLRFFLFARLATFEPFFALFAEAGVAQTAHSTGVVNMVLFCEEKAHRETTEETVSLALHETTHAWMATYLRQKYDRPIVLPPYVDEGLATYVASLWSPSVAAIPAKRLADWRKRGFKPGSLESLRTHDGFYGGDHAVENYWVSEQLIERLLGPPDKGIESIKAFLDAYADSGDDLKAWRAVSKKDAAAEYAALVAGT